MMEKFEREHNYEPLVERIFIRNIHTRLGGSEARAALRRSTTDWVKVAPSAAFDADKMQEL